MTSPGFGKTRNKWVLLRQAERAELRAQAWENSSGKPYGLDPKQTAQECRKLAAEFRRMAEEMKDDTGTP